MRSKPIDCDENMKTQQCFIKCCDYQHKSCLLSGGVFLNMLHSNVKSCGRNHIHYICVNYQSMREK